jgi:hypothetical protein
VCPPDADQGEAKAPRLQLSAGRLTGRLRSFLTLYVARPQGMVSRATATAEEWAMLKGVYAAQSTARQMHLKQELTSYASQWSSSRTMCLRASLRARERADAEDAHPEEPAEAPASPVTSPAPVCCASGERRAPAQV